MFKLTKKILTDARDTIGTRDTWGKGWAAEDGCYCLGGAIANAVTGNPNNMYNDEFNDLFKDFVLRAELSLVDSPDDTSGYQWVEYVYNYNDTNAYSKVIELLDKVIETFGD